MEQFTDNLVLITVLLVLFAAKVVQKALHLVLIALHFL
jgi:hypothetical protein